MHALHKPVKPIVSDHEHKLRGFHENNYELFVLSIYELLPPLLHYSYYASSVLQNITP